MQDQRIQHRRRLVGLSPIPRLAPLRQDGYDTSYKVSMSSNAPTVRVLDVHHQTRRALELFERIQVSRSMRAKDSPSNGNASQRCCSAFRRVCPPKGYQREDSTPRIDRLSYFSSPRVHLESKSIR